MNNEQCVRHAQLFIIHYSLFIVHRVTTLSTVLNSLQ